MIHGFDDSRDFGKTFYGQMPTSLHESKNDRKLPKLISLRRSQWICFEEWNNASYEI